MDVDPPFWAARRPHAYVATREAAMAMFGKSRPFDRFYLLCTLDRMRRTLGAVRSSP
jgi:hypothetical protein